MLHAAFSTGGTYPACQSLRRDTYPVTKTCLGLRRKAQMLTLAMIRAVCMILCSGLSFPLPGEGKQEIGLSDLECLPAPKPSGLFTVLCFHSEPLVHLLLMERTKPQCLDGAGSAPGPQSRKRRGPLHPLRRAAEPDYGLLCPVCSGKRQQSPHSQPTRLSKPSSL